MMNETKGKRYEIPDYKFGGLKQKIDALAKRAAKLGIEPLVLTVGETTTRMIEIDRVVYEGSTATVTGHEMVQVTFVECFLKGESPRLNGWELLGVIDLADLGVIIREVPGKTVPLSFTATHNYCDHCKSVRGRVKVYVVEHEDGRIAQVGKNCLKDFLGHKDADLIAQLAAMVADITMFIGGGDGEEREERTGRGAYYLPLRSFLNVVAADIRLHGWVSSKMADEQIKLSTADAAMAIVTDKKAIRPEITAADIELVDNTIDYVTNTLAKKVSSSYEANLVTLIVDKDCFEPKYKGFVASAVRAYQLSIERAITEQQRQKNAGASSYVSEVGKRAIFTITVLATRIIDGHYGQSTIVNMIDGSGNKLTWFASGTVEMTTGTPYTIKATVKKHETYRDEKITQLSRVAVVKQLAAAA